MKFQAEIEHIRTLKQGSKMVLAIDDTNTDYVMQHVQNYRKLPLTVELLVDADERKKQLAMISREQRAKIYAIFRDIAAYTGHAPEEIKAQMKQAFISNYPYEDFSLANCPKELACDFITMRMSRFTCGYVSRRRSAASVVNLRKFTIGMLLAQGGTAVLMTIPITARWPSAGSTIARSSRSAGKPSPRSIMSSA